MKSPDLSWKYHLDYYPQWRFMMLVAEGTTLLMETLRSAATLQS